jgi:ATP synthase protein I
MALAVLAILFVDANAAVSALIGGSIGLIANLGYVLRALRMNSSTDPVKVYQAQAAGEGFKFLLTLVGFALVFLGYKEVAVLPLFLGYASTFVIYWMALLKNR